MKPQKQIRERDIEKYLVKRVKELGGEVRKVKWIGRSGAPDRLVMLPMRRIEGYFTLKGLVPMRYERQPAIWVELKAPSVKPEAHQVREHKRMRDMGQRVEVIDSFEGVDKLLGV